MTGAVIGIVGGGVGGLASAIALSREGHNVKVYEQASQFARIGADVNLTPNAVRALDGLGVGDAVRRTAARPTYRVSRMWDTGAETSRLEMAEAAEKSYGAPQLTIHRADLLKALENAVPEKRIRLGKRVESVSQDGYNVHLRFTDGSEDVVDAAIGADGIHSQVRGALFGPESPSFTGLVSYRSVVAQSKVGAGELDAFTKWWGPDPATQIVTFPLNRGSDTFVFATTAQDDWRQESWTMPGDVAELRQVYAEFHPDARALLDACTEVTKSALYVRDPLPNWSIGRCTLLGDACHPMTPFMAQGACMAIEDAVVLSRCLAGATTQTIVGALKTYEAARKDRTARIQLASRQNEWLKEGGNADWVYGYDAWTVPLG